MKKNYILLFIIGLITLFSQAQDIVYSFDTTDDTEEWIRIPSQTTAVTQSEGTLIVGTDITNFGGIMSPDLNLSDTDYEFVELVVQNNTSFTGFQLLSYVTGGNVGNTASKTNFEISADGNFHTILVAIPATPSDNNGVITALGIRVKGDAAEGESLVFDSITIKKAVEPSFDGFVKNPNFDDIDGILGSWSIAGTGGTFAVSNDTTTGNQAAEFTFENEIATNPPTLFNNYRWAIDPAVDNSQSVTITWDMKYTDNPGDVQVSVIPRWRKNIASGGSGDRVTYGNQKNATADWAEYSFTRTISSDCSSLDTPEEGTNCYDTETYDDIELGMAVKFGATGVKLLMDNIRTSIQETALGTENNIKDALSISVYPNPATDIIAIKTPTKIKEIKAINILGQVTIDQNGPSEKLNISSLKSGIYILKIMQENGSIATKRFIKK
ncbi:MAG: T9SS type A sorting domain-containing protein [Polaribacter sp.]|nr:T9SS type A sorting domain-containing protein [Polaribacter sp.]